MLFPASGSPWSWFWTWSLSPIRAFSPSLAVSLSSPQSTHSHLPLTLLLQGLSPSLPLPFSPGSNPLDPASEFQLRCCSVSLPSLQTHLSSASVDARSVCITFLILSLLASPGCSLELPPTRFSLILLRLFRLFRYARSLPLIPLTAAAALPRDPSRLGRSS